VTPQLQQQQLTNQNYSQNQFPFPVASRGKRLGGILLDILFISLTLYIGWTIWALIVMKDGQTPGKQVLKMRTYATTTNRPATWGHMAIRSLLIPLVFGAVYLLLWFASLYDAIGPFLTLIIVVTELILFFTSPINQRLTDRWAKTVILDETPRWAQQY
jgi:uncharacterized RDD family membrane protein YckC